MDQLLQKPPQIFQRAPGVEFYTILANCRKMFFNIFSIFRILQSTVLIAGAIQSYKEVDIYFIASEEVTSGWETEICANPIPILLCATEVDSVKFQCAYTGSLSKTFLGRNNDSKFSRFSDLRRFDHGSIWKRNATRGDCFYCWAEDSSPKRSNAYTIRFEQDCPPSKVEMRQVHPVGASATLDCWGADIQERHNVEWYFRSFQLPVQFLPVSKSWGFQVEFAKGNTSATISNLSDLHSGTYQCIVRFLESNLRFQRQFDIWVRGKPLKPSDPRVVTISDKGATLEWKSTNPDSNHRGNFQVKWLESDKIGDLNNTNPTVQNEPKIILSDLKPFTQYLIEVKEINDHGESQPASAMFLTRNSSYETLGYDLEILASANQELPLQCPFKDDGDDKIRGWNLYRQNGSEWDLLADASSSASSYRIHRFSQIDIGSYKCVLPNQNSEIIARLILVEPPSQPESLACRRGPDGKVIATWSLPEVSKKLSDTRSDTERYKFMYKKVGGAAGWAQKIIPGGAKHEFVIDGDSGNDLYMIEVTAVNRAGQSSTGIIFCYV